MLAESCIGVTMSKYQYGTPKVARKAMVVKLPHEENASRTFPKKMTLGRKMGRDPPYALF